MGASSIVVPFLADSIDLNNTQQESGYERGGHAAYGVSKLGLNMWSYHLSSFLQTAGKSISVNCVDPGTVSTKLLFAGWGEVSYVALSVEEADDVFWSATADELANVTGKYFVNRKSRQSSGVSYETDRQVELWKLLERQTGASFHLEDAPASTQKMNEMGTK
jgi:NAD(P)-dependent dehydrogenase (short-subunit alcohol dehydrogenase family)